MAELSFPLDNTDYGAEEAQLWFSGRTSGVFASNELGVSAGDGMTVILGKGRAWLAYAQFAGVVYANTTETTLTVATSNPNFDRIDRVVIRFDRTGNTINARIIQGVASSTPTAPNIVRNDSTYDISVAQIRVKTGVTEITSADITDERLNSAVCGLMEDGVTGIDTSVFQSQWNALLSNLQNALDNVTAGKVLNKTRFSLYAPASGWTEQADGSFTQQISADGMLETDSCYVDIDMSDATADTFEALSAAWSMVSKATTQNGSLLIVSFSGAPETDMTIKAEVFR